MNKHLLTLAVAALSFAAASAQSFDATTEDGFNQFTVVNANADDYTFTFNEDGYAYYAYNQSLAANDWIISPAVNLEAGKSYSIKASVKQITTYPSDKEKFAVTIGKAATPDAQTTELYKNESFQNRSFSEYGGNFTPTEDGEYYIAVHLYSAAYSGNFAVSGMSVQEFIPLPGAPTGLQVTPAAEGALQASLSWNWPTNNAAGGAGQAITSGVVYRSTSALYSSPSSTYIIATIEGGQPGEAATFVDTDVPSAGKYYYAVAARNENGENGAAAYLQSDWIGPDNGISSISKVTATPVDDNTVSIAIQHDLTGKNGGYIDPTAISYSISRKGTASGTTSLEDNFTGEWPYIDSTITTADSYAYTVTPKLNGSSTFGTTSNTVVCGPAANVPYSNSFDSSADFGLLTVFHGDANSRDWTYNSSNKCAYFWQSSGKRADAYMVLPKIRLKAGKSYAVNFSAWVTRNNPKDLKVVIGSEPTAEQLTTEIMPTTSIEASASTSGYKECFFTVPADGNYYIAFHADWASSPNTNDLFVDNIEVVESLTIPNAVADFSAAADEAEPMTVNLAWTMPSLSKAGEQLTETLDVELSRNNTVIYTASAEPGAEMTYADTEITQPGAVSYSIVVKLGEATSDAATTAIEWVGLDIPKPVTNLSAENVDNVVTLSFDAPVEGLHNGAIGQVHYIVMRGEDVLADNLTETTFSENVADFPLAKYTYTVVAANATGQSEAASTALVIGDAISLPYSPDMNDPATFDTWLLGEKGWAYSSSNQGLTHSYSATEHTAYTPLFDAVIGEYSITYKATCYSYRYPEVLEIYLVPEEATRAAEPVLLHTATITTSSYPDDQVVDFAIADPGKYRIGYKCATDDMLYLTLKKADLALVKATGIASLNADAKIAYNVATKEIRTAKPTDITIFAIDGKIVAAAADASAISVAHLPAGAYVARTADHLTIKFIKK